MLSKDDGNARLVVKDNGIGIQKEKLNKIFLQFYQIYTSVIREQPSTGLGLAICRGIIEAHNGKIFAKSEGRNKGAEIHILLPMIKTNQIVL